VTANEKPATGDEKPKEEPKPSGTDAGQETPTTPDRLPEDHPAVLALAKANKEAADLRTKVKKFEDASKSDLERATGEAADHKQRADAAELRALQLEIGGEKGLTPAQARRLQGKTREEIEKDADELLESFGKGTGEKPPARKPGERLRGSSEPEEEPEMDVDKVVAKVPRL
jgi:hypothetical protein